jgi:hypothetical protein
MKMLKRLLSLSFTRRSWVVRSRPRIDAPLSSTVDADEFARLLTSGRTGDLKILARRLSAPTRVRI